MQSRLRHQPQECTVRAKTCQQLSPDQPLAMLCLHAVATADSTCQNLHCPIVQQTLGMAWLLASHASKPACLLITGYAGKGAVLLFQLMRRKASAAHLIICLLNAPKDYCLHCIWLRGGAVHECTEIAVGFLRLGIKLDIPLPSLLLQADGAFV